MIELSRLKILVALHELGTVHAAATRLHVSPSAASQQLATLTRDAGTALTEADGRTLRLTDAGRVLVEHAYALLALAERAAGDVQAASAGDLGRLTVGAYASTISSLLLPAVARLRDRHPGLSTDVREITGPGALDALSNGELDIVVTVDANGSAPEDPRHSSITLGTDHLDLALPADHPHASGVAVELASLAHEDWVGTLAGDACDTLVHRACADAGFRPRVRHRVNDRTATLAMVAAGLGIAAVPRVTAAPIPRGVTIVPADGDPLRRPALALVRRGSETRPAVARCLTALQDIAGTTGCA